MCDSTCRKKVVVDEWVKQPTLPQETGIIFRLGSLNIVFFSKQTYLVRFRHMCYCCLCVSSM